VGLVAAADYAIATEQAEIKLSELTIGIGPFVVGPVVERKIGVSAFTQLAIDAGMWANAQWAGRKGLFAEVHLTAEGMDGIPFKVSKHACFTQGPTAWLK
jgi:methylglutaconyl-CoA hydratase